MRLLDHPNVVPLKNCFYSTTDKNEVYLNVVLEYVPETVYRMSRHYVRMNQHMPMLYVQLYAYQVKLLLTFISFADCTITHLLTISYYVLRFAVGLTTFTMSFVFAIVISSHKIYW